MLNCFLQEVTALFTDCPAKYTSCEYAGNTNWYVYFDSENDAQSALRYLRESVKEFQGKPIMVSVKSCCVHVNTGGFSASVSVKMLVSYGTLLCINFYK